ncbi:MAG: hypothetical protein P1U32_03320 [Legionellaceae bacterium]|nr:hypothetical protein [Legionellaceae bacterium]
MLLLMLDESSLSFGMGGEFIVVGVIDAGRLFRESPSSSSE